MSECVVCGTDDSAKACRHCGAVVCDDHWLPDKHECDGANGADTSDSRRSLPELDRGESRSGMLIVIVLVALFGMAFVVGGFEEPAEYNATAVERAAVERVNEARTANGLAPLEFSRPLSNNGRAWSQKMAWHGKIFHADQSEISCLPNGENVLYTYWKAQIDTENGEKYFATSRELGRGIANQWLNSSGHRENIMREGFESTGIGVYKPDSDGVESRVYATQRLCGSGTF